MPPVFQNLECYHRHHVRTQLQLFLPNTAAVEEQLLVLDTVYQATAMPYEEIARPYLWVVAAGYTLTAQQLLHLLQWSVRLLITWPQFVEWYVLPFVQQQGPALATDLSQMFKAAA